LTATSDTIGESQPTGDHCRESQLEAVRDNPPRAPTTQRPASFSLNCRADTMAYRIAALPTQSRSASTALRVRIEARQSARATIEVSPSVARGTMLPSAECARPFQGDRGLPAQHDFGPVDGSRATRTARLVRHRPRLPIRRPNSIEHTSLGFRAGSDEHVSRVERLMVGPQRDGRDVKPAENILR
jgi:hypothetical protein